MSHSKILVLEDSAYDCDHIFDEMSTYGNGVDYVTESESEYSDDFKWAMVYMSELGFVPNADKNGFELESADTFWNAMTADISQIMEDDGGVTVRNRFELEDRLGMKRGFWIYYDGELYTLPYFVQFYKPHKMWKVTKFLDYHY